MIRAVIFDLDGVVVDSEPLYQEAEERLFREEGITIPLEDWKYFRGVSEQRFYELARERYHVSLPVDELRSRGREYIFTLFKERLKFMPGFVDLHRDLEGRVLLGLVTSSPGEIYSWVERRLGLERYFQEVIYGGMTTHSKPHPEPYEMMMRRLAVMPWETVVVEDSIPGLISAWAAGAWTIALTGSVPEEDMPPAHAIVHSLADLSLQFILDLGGSPLATRPGVAAAGEAAKPPVGHRMPFR